MKKLLLVVLFLCSTAYADMRDCRDAGGTVCSHDDVLIVASGSGKTSTSAVDCAIACASLAASAGNAMGEDWICVVTASNEVSSKYPAGFLTGRASAPGRHGAPSGTYCECDLMCEKCVDCDSDGE